MQCIVSCARKYFMATQPFRPPKLRFFYFSVQAISIGIPGSFRIPTKRLYLDQKPVSYRWNLCQEPYFQSRKNQKTAKVKFNKRTDFLWFKSWLFACLNCSYELHLWYPAEPAVLFSYDALKLSWLAMYKVIFNLSITYYED